MDQARQGKFFYVTHVSNEGSKSTLHKTSKASVQHAEEDIVKEHLKRNKISEISRFLQSSAWSLME